MTKKRALGKKGTTVKKGAASAKLKIIQLPKRKEKATKPKGRIILKKSKKITLKKVTTKTTATKAKPSKKQVLKKKHGIKVVSKTRSISPEQKEELKKLHGILSDPFVRQMLIEVGGENALVIVRNFYGSHSDEELSKNLQLRISDVRATLNRLHNEGLVKYVREKDSETGWYSYSWTLNKDQIMEWVTEYAEKANGHNGKEGTDYYFCPKCGFGSIIEFADAHDNEFKCNKCTKPLEFLEEGHFSSINQYLRRT